MLKLGKLKRCCNKIIPKICILILSIILGLILMVAVYAIPQDSMERHVANSLEVLEGEGSYPSLYGQPDIRMTVDNFGDWRVFLLNTRGISRDNVTDATMLHIAVYEENAGLLKRAMGNARGVRFVSGEIENLCMYLDGEEQYEETAYPRYWHGYLVILKPILLFLTYVQIRWLNVLLMSILLILLLVFITRKGNIKDTFLLLYSILFAMPAVIPFCMQYCTMSYIVLFAMIYIVVRSGTMYSVWLENFFLIVGIITGYMDLLTFPLLGLGMPLVYLLNRTREGSLKDRLVKVGDCCLHWGIGYAVMWASKWVIASVILKENVIIDAIKQIAFRTSRLSEWGDSEISFFQALASNLSCYTNVYFLALILAGIIWLMIYLKTHKNEKFQKEHWIPDLVMAILPFIWVFVLKNHSYGHGSFTYRIFSLTVYAGMSIFLCGRKKGNL